MAHDAFERSLSGSGQAHNAEEQSLERQLRELQDILSYLLKRADLAVAQSVETQRRLADYRKERQSFAESVYAGINGNAEQIAALRSRLEAAASAEEILHRAAGGPPAQAARSHAKPKRDRHGMFCVRGGAAALVPAALFAGDGKLAALWGGLRLARAAFRAKRRVATAAVLLAALGGTAGGSVAANIGHAPGRALVMTGPRVHHRRREAQVPLPPAAPVAHRRCHDHDQVTVLAAGAERCRETDRDSRAVAGASPLPSPVPSPASTTPVPGPTATPVPTPTAPVPTPTPTLPVPTPSATGPAGTVCQLLPPLCKRGQ